MKISKYIFRERIARGAESVLYRATSDLGDQYCVKTIRNWLGRALAPAVRKHDEEKLDASYRSKVRHLANEFDVGTKLSQKGDMPIVRMYELKPVKLYLCEIGHDLLMEYIDGDDLGDRRALRMLTLHDKINYFYQTAVGLKYVHETGFVHLDMKPSNIMVSRGLVKLIDFGVSIPIGQRPRAIAGTAGYMSPEQLTRDHVDERTDIFALGVTFAVIFGGKRLRQRKEDIREGMTKMEAQFQMAKTDAPMITDVPEAQKIPQLSSLIQRCTIPRREDRIKDIDSIIMSLRRVADDLDLKLREPV